MRILSTATRVYDAVQTPYVQIRFQRQLAFLRSKFSRHSSLTELFLSTMAE